MNFNRERSYSLRNPSLFLVRHALDRYLVFSVFEFKLSCSNINNIYLNLHLSFIYLLTSHFHSALQLTITTIKYLIHLSQNCFVLTNFLYLLGPHCLVLAVPRVIYCKYEILDSSDMLWLNMKRDMSSENAIYILIFLDIFKTSQNYFTYLYYLPFSYLFVCVSYLKLMEFGAIHN